MKFLRMWSVWETRWWHEKVLGHNVSPLADTFDGLFDNQCSCGFWWFA